MDLSKNSIQPKLRRDLNEKAMKNRIPLNGTFELTPRCNMNCRMCYIRMSQEEMFQKGRERTAAEWIEMGKICKEQGLLFLLITGGEPFLREDFKEIYTELGKMGFIMSINSNGTLINEKTIEWLKLNPPSKINVTLYGASNDTYEKLCRNPKGFDQVTRGIDLLLKAGISVGINASFTPYNIHDMEGIYEFAKERGLRVNPAIYMFPPIRNDECKGMCENVRLTPKEAGQALFNSKKCEIHEVLFPYFLQQVKKGRICANEDEECGYGEGEQVSCVAGRSSFWITWNGDMTPCGMMQHPAVRPFENGFTDSWQELCKKTDEILLPSECSHCSKRHACKICAALSIAEGDGNSRKKPEYLCDMTDEYLRLCDEYIEERVQDEK